MSIKLVTIPRVPLVKTGTYALSTGVTTFTVEDLQWAVAATNFPGVRTPVLKFGHEEKQLTQQPVVGRASNLEFDPADETLYGDYVGVPEWLADIIPIAYPDRSIEGMRNVSIQGRKHLFVLTAVALLGEDAPGVDTLPDLYELFYGKDGGEVSAEGDTEKVAVIIRGGNLPPERVEASIEVADITRAYYEGPGQDYAWWIRTVRLDPNELIVENDDEAKLYRVPFEISGEEVEFGEAVEVKIRYEDVAAMVASVGAPLVVHASRAESRPGTTRKETASVDYRAKLIEQLGLPADSSDEDIARAQAGESATTPSTEAPSVETPSTEVETPAAPASIPEGMVLMDAETVQQLQQGALAAAGLVEERRVERRDSAIQAAIDAGKIKAERADHYKKLFDLDPEGTGAALAAMPAGLVVPVGEIGSADPGSEIAATGGEAYDLNWLSPRERAVVEASRQGKLDVPLVSGESPAQVARIMNGAA